MTMPTPPARRSRPARLATGVLLVALGGSGAVSGSLLTIVGLFGAHNAVGWAALATLVSVLLLGAGIPLTISGAKGRTRTDPPVAAIALGVASVVLAIVMWPLPIVEPCFWIILLVAAVLAVRSVIARGWTVAVIVAVALVVLSVGGAVAVHVVRGQAAQDALESSVIRFEASSDGGSALFIEATMAGVTIGEPIVFADLEDEPLPWSLEQPIEPPTEYDDWYLRVTVPIEATTVTCRVTVDGVVLAEETVEATNDGFTGPSADCHASASALFD